MRYVLLVTADRALRAELTDLLESMDVAVDPVAAGCDAVEMLEKYTYDYVISDQKLPDLGALDLLPHINAGETTFLVIAAEESAVRMLSEIAPASVRGLVRPIKPAHVRKLLAEAPVEYCEPGAAREPASKPRRRSSQGTLGQMLGNCGPMLQVYDMIARVAPTHASVMLIGPSGTGKELVARAIHERGDRSDKPFVAINCGAIPESLIESELFGHEKGAFTGADSQRAGVFARAHGGTLFLDEITEMGVEMQSRLLRVLETGRYHRVGGESELTADFRLITATNRSPLDAVKEGVFREDLLYRVSVFPIQLPSLRERGDDVILLANHFLAALNQAGGTDKHLTKTAERRLRAYTWPGNVRQLRNMVERAYILEDNDIDMLCLDPLLHDDAEAAESVVPPVAPAAEAVAESAGHAAKAAVLADEIVVVVGTTIEDAERQLILRTLDEYGGDKRKTAEVLGISLKTLYNRLNTYAEHDAAPAADDASAD